jgi:TetR/AcrR family transcriptional regulator, regulator of cefoperazone and chloramphenicol sensitivity
VALAHTGLARPQAEDTRGRLLAAASAVFADRGYYAATVREICKRDKVNGALVNYHFGDKLELYAEVLRNSLDADEQRNLQELFTRHEDPEILLRKIIRVMLDCLHKRRESGNVHMRLMLHELAQPTPAFARVVDETIKPLHDAMRALLGRSLGLAPEDDKTRLCAQSIIGQVIHYAHHSPVITRLWPELKMTPQRQELVAGHIADFSLSYLRAARGGKTPASAKPSPSARKPKALPRSERT